MGYKKIFCFTLIAVLAVCTPACKRLSEIPSGVRQEILKEEAPLMELRIEEGYVSQGYYYQQLQESDRATYKELLQGVEAQDAEVYVHGVDSDSIGKVYEFLLYDRPELFWCSGTLEMATYEDYTMAKPKYTCTTEERMQRQGVIEQAASECLMGISSDWGEYDKIKYICDYIVNTVEYELNVADSQNIYSVFGNRVSVCAGYSRAMQYLLGKLGMECIYVTGEVKDRGAHAWNIVKCDGLYYQLDVTWGDPLFLQEEVKAAAAGQNINYDYLCCTDEELYKTHIPDKKVTFPACSSGNYNYYVLNGMYYEQYDPEVVLQAMNHSIYNKKSSYICKFATEELYVQAKDDVLNNLAQHAVENLAEYYGLSSVQYTYLEDSNTNKIVIFWSYEQIE